MLTLTMLTVNVRYSAERATGTKASCRVVSFGSELLRFHCVVGRLIKGTGLDLDVRWNRPWHSYCWQSATVILISGWSS